MRESKRILGYGHEDWGQLSADSGSVSPHKLAPDQSPTNPQFTNRSAPQRILPFRNIWLSPRSTTAELISRNRRSYIYPLAMLGGVAHLLAQAYIFGVPQLPTLLLIPLMVVQACFLGLAWLYVFARLLKLTGNFFGGQAAAKDIEVPVGWSRLPEIVAIPALAALLVLSILYSKGSLAAWPPWLFPVFQWGLSAVAVVAMLWGMIILIAGVTAAQSFPVWKGIASSLIAMLLGLVLLLCLILPVYLIRSFM